MMMRKTLLPLLAYATCASFLFSCKKADLLEEPQLKAKPVKIKQAACNASSLSFSAGNFPAKTIFTTRFTGSSMEVDAGVFSAGTIGYTIPLIVQTSGQNIVFSKPGNPGQTVLVAYLDKKGRVEKILPGTAPDPSFLATTFEYDGIRLSSMHITLNNHVLTSNFSYDSRGNIVSIDDLAIPGEPSPGSVVYKYSDNVKASQQFYLDEPRKFSWNSFTLLQYIGMFPELQPVNLRVYAKMIWGAGYVAYEANIANHHLDNEGRLTGYDIVSPMTGGTVASYKVGWTCNMGSGDDNDDQGADLNLQ